MTISHNHHVGVYENSLSPEICNHIIELSKEVELSPRTPEEGGNLFKDDFSCHLWHLKKDYSKEIKNILFQCLNHYVEKYPVFKNYAPVVMTGYKFQTTLPSGGYHTWHPEMGSFSTRDRIAVWTIYLNDIKEGGETEFLHQSLRLPPKQGTISIFPASYTHLHRGNPPLSKEKHILTGWIEFENLSYQRLIPNCIPPYEGGN